VQNNLRIRSFQATRHSRSTKILVAEPAFARPIEMRDADRRRPSVQANDVELAALIHVFIVWWWPNGVGSLHLNGIQNPQKLRLLACLSMYATPKHLARVASPPFRDHCCAYIPAGKGWANKL